MSHTKRMLIAAGLSMALSAAAHAEFSGTAALLTDYVFRGISNTDGDPAVHASLDYSHGVGFYAGVWASNVKFRENAFLEVPEETVSEAGIEIDYYLGIARDFPFGGNWEVGAIYYTYPGADSSLEYDYWEALIALGYTFESAVKPDIRLEVYHSPEYFGESGKTYYGSGRFGLSLPAEFGLGFSAGKTFFDNGQLEDYVDWKAELTKGVAGFDLGLAYTDTNLSKEDCDDEDICEARVVFSVSRTF